MTTIGYARVSTDGPGAGRCQRWLRAIERVAIWPLTRNDLPMDFRASAAQSLPHQSGLALHDRKVPRKYGGNSIWTMR